MERWGIGTAPVSGFVAAGAPVLGSRSTKPASVIFDDPSRHVKQNRADGIDRPN
jgi:hypothetical protein